MSSKLPLATAIAQRVDEASLQLAVKTGLERSRGIQAMAEGLDAAQAEILEANTLDLEISREMAVSDVLQDWLKLTPERLQQAIQLLYRLGESADPLLRVMGAPYPIASSQTYCQLVPLGVITLVYEAFPELAAIAAGLCLRTGNALILRGTSEASHTNAVIAQVLQRAIATAQLPPGTIEWISSEEGISMAELITQDPYVNLIIPYGRASFVQHISQHSTVPVLRTAMGNCYLYCSPSGDLDLARSMILDSHASEPDPVNAIEKVLLNQSQSRSSLMRFFVTLQEQGFSLRAEPELVEQFSELLTPMQPQEWKLAYLKKIISFKLVEDLDAAIAWMNQHSSNHADCLVTESYTESRHFAQNVNSALVYINASPRFSRNPKQSDSIFLGISNQKGRRRGLIGVESLMTLKQVVQGRGEL
ncbi:glutamate-5-semialdehyde dehydrogenase [Spirulina major CS-329]|uniref:glutamate-5-semialdehyde dehydrogenase n=1 Tax=Spirulina TaxID=1154 RepID=UPI00232B1E29|nr:MULTISPECIES: glutamate-5-semialdehyde dehydrogenase [Spirulina]MDB9496686.1 glutamate-5-semialdehyde dehydrogenase [Spirulina subsalsa CS-330]MDB9504191.1 glutamate-5-semialdehyde dehydrogenase [Spirulina major CS-329]